MWAIGHAKRTVSICVRRTGALAAAFNLRLAPHLWAGAPASIEGLYVAAIPDHPDLGITVRDNFVERHARRS